MFKRDPLSLICFLEWLGVFSHRRWWMCVCALCSVLWLWIWWESGSIHLGVIFSLNETPETNVANLTSPQAPRGPITRGIISSVWPLCCTNLYMCYTLMLHLQILNPPYEICQLILSDWRGMVINWKRVMTVCQTNVYVFECGFCCLQFVLLKLLSSRKKWCYVSVKLDTNLIFPFKHLASSWSVCLCLCPPAEIRAQLVEQQKCLDQQTEMRVQLLQDLQDFFRKKAEIEMEYSRNLEKLAERFMAKTRSTKDHQQYKWGDAPSQCFCLCPGFSWVDLWSWE